MEASDGSSKSLLILHKLVFRFPLGRKFAAQGHVKCRWWFGREAFLENIPQDRTWNFSPCPSLTDLGEIRDVVSSLGWEPLSLDQLETLEIRKGNSNPRCLKNKITMTFIKCAPFPPNTLHDNDVCICFCHISKNEKRSPFMGHSKISLIWN